MSAMKNFAAITGLHPFNLNRISFVFGFSIAALVIAKLVNANLFCGFHKDVFVDLPLGVVLFFGYCITPLLGLAVNREPTTKAGRGCRTFAIVLISAWLWLTVYAILMMLVWEAIYGMGADPAYDPLKICGNRTVDNVRTQFRNAMPTFDVFQRIDMVYKIAVGLGWLVLMPFPYAAFVLFIDHIDNSQNHQALEDQASGKSAEENDETIIWMEESSEGNTDQPSAIAEQGSIDIEDESAPEDAAREAADRKSEVGSVDMRMENLRNEINEPGSNTEPQSKEEPKFSFVDEEKEEEATTAKAAIKYSK